MTKRELVENVAKKMNMTVSESEGILNAFLEEIMKTMAIGEKVKIVGFGSFETFLAKERKGHNPYSNQAIIIPEHRIARFKAGKCLKNYMDTEDYKNKYKRINY